MKNKFISLILALCLCVPFVPVSAATNTANYDESNAITLSKTLNIMVGDENGDMHLDSFVSRAEFTKIAVAMSQYRNMVPTSGTTSVFTDCTFRHWASPYVRVAVTNGMMNGYPDGTFRPDNTVLLEEAATVMLKLLGYTTDDFGTSWPYGQIGIATNAHVIDNVAAGVGAELTRRDVLKLIYNTLIAQPKGGQSGDKYLQKLDCNLYEDAVIIATNDENSGVTAGYVLTSAGSFKIGSDFDHNLIGRKGDLIVKNSDYAAFMQSVQTVQKNVVYSKLDDSIVTYHDGMMTNFKQDSATTVYEDTNKTTYGAIKSSLTTGDTIYLMKDAGGNVDYMTVVKDNLDGPYTATGSAYLDRFSTDSSMTVMRDGVKSSRSAVGANDIVYYLKDINTVFAYSRKVTGVYEKATPNKDMPSSVTVSGTEYTLESAAAFDKLSSNGSYKYGDTVTLLMGKDGQIADVLTATAQATSESLAGYLTATGTKEFDNSDGDRYTAVYADLIQPDGTLLEVITDKNYSSYINRAMTVNFSGGVAKLNAVKNGSSVSGTADASEMKIGSASVADDMQILDVTTSSDDNPGSYLRVYMQRLDGVNISGSQVMYYDKNSDGEISKLILNNVTGDAFEYGVVTNVSTSGGGGGSMSTTSRRYTCDVDGKTYTCSINYGGAITGSSPAGFAVSNGNINSIVKLNSAGQVSSIGDGTVTINGDESLMSDKVVVYKYSGASERTYTIMPLSELKANLSSYSVAAYRDKTEARGGRVRVLLAKAK